MDRWITFRVLDLGLDIFDGVAALDLQRDGLPRQRLHEDLPLRRRQRACFPRSLCSPAELAVRFAAVGDELAR